MISIFLNAILLITYLFISYGWYTNQHNINYLLTFTVTI